MMTVSLNHDKPGPVVTQESCQKDYI